MKTSPCPHSALQERPVTFRDGTRHIEALCSLCGRHIKYVSQRPPEEQILYFGRYKGRLILDVVHEDPSYAAWLRDAGCLRGAQRDILVVALDEANG